MMQIYDSRNEILHLEVARWLDQVGCVMGQNRFGLKQGSLLQVKTESVKLGWFANIFSPFFNFYIYLMH